MTILRGVSGFTVIVGIILCGFALSFGADWTLYYQDGMEKIFYDKGTVEVPRKGQVRVTVKATLFDAQEGNVRRLELMCNYHSYRVISDKVDPVTGAFVDQPGAGSYKYTWFPYDSRMMALYQNLCE
ncbi:MAG TPA: hypothetical protein VGJ94_13895 [Syntrophorhabdaceae bacterium]|jgi:hypothetical protein